MPSWLNHAAVAGGRNGTTSHTVAPDGTGGTVVSGSAFTPSSGNLLVVVVQGPVTSTTPSGWTLPASGSAVNNTGLYVWYRTAVAGSNALTTSHGGASNYPVMYHFFEFASGSTFVKAAAATAVAANGGAGPSLTSLTGTNAVFGAVGQINNAGFSGPQSFTWAAGTELTDYCEVLSGTDGYNYSLTNADGYTGATWSAAATSTQTGISVERIVFAVNAVGGGATGATVTAVPMAATALAPAPTVTTSSGATVVAVAATATALMPAPVVSGESVVSGGGPMAATAQFPAPTVTAVRNATVTSVAATATASMPAPVVTASAGATVLAVPMTVTALAPAPTVTGGVGGSATVNAVPAVATALMPVPTVTTIRNVSVIAPVAVATATAIPPSRVGVPPVTLCFTPPTRPLKAGPPSDRLWGRVTNARGSAVVLYDDGRIMTSEIAPPSDDPGVARVWPGGRTYVVSRDEYDLLLEAGYSANLSEVS